MGRACLRHEEETRARSRRVWRWIEQDSVAAHHGILGAISSGKEYLPGEQIALRECLHMKGSKEVVRMLWDNCVGADPRPASAAVLDEVYELAEAAQGTGE